MTDHLFGQHCKIADLHRLAILQQAKVFAAQVFDRLSLAVAHKHIHVDDRDLHLVDELESTDRDLLGGVIGP